MLNCVKIVEALEQVQSVKIKCLSKINRVLEQNVSKMLEQVIKIRLYKDKIEQDHRVNDAMN